MVGAKFVNHHLISTVHQKGIKVVGVVPWAGGRREDVQVDKSQCGPPEVGLDFQNFRRVKVGTHSWGGGEERN